MKKSRFTDSQVMMILTRTEPTILVLQLCLELDIVSVTFYKWCSKYGGMHTSKIARMKELEAENSAVYV